MAWFQVDNEDYADVEPEVGGRRSCMPSISK